MNDTIRPSKLRIGGINYKIAYQPNIKSEDGKLLYGDICYETSTIRINEDHSGPVQLATLLHEAIHGILNHAAITDHDERTVEIVANGMNQVLMDNPGAFRFSNE